MTRAAAQPHDDESWSPLEVRVIDDPDTAAGLSQEWDALADRCGAGPLMRSQHALTWWRHLGKGRLLVVTVREAGQLVALAPLHERRVGPVWVVRWLGHGLGTVAEVLVDPGREAAAELVWAALSGPLRVWELVECRDGAAGLPHAGRYPGSRRDTAVRKRDVCPVTDLADGFDGLVKRTGKKNLRRMLKRWERLLLASGSTYRVEVVGDAAGFEAQLRDLRSVMNAAESDRPRLHLLQPPYEAFVLDYLRALFAGREAVSVVGYLDDVPAAMQVCLRHGDSLALWIARHDPRFAWASPGHLVQRDTYVWAESAGVTRVDLLLGDSQKKRLWATDSYDTLEVMSGLPTTTALVRGTERVVGAARRART